MRQEVLSVYPAIEKMRLRRWCPDVTAVKIGSGVAARRLSLVAVGAEPDRTRPEPVARSVPSIQ
jgi:hypothetical protein